MYPYDTPQNPSAIQEQLKKLMDQTSQLMTTSGPQQKHVTKVNGMAGAEAMAASLPSGSDDIFVDAEDSVIYLVIVDTSGYRTITPYDISPKKIVKQEDTLKSIEERLTKLEEAILNGKSDSTTNYTKPKPRDGRNAESVRSVDKG